MSHLNIVHLVDRSSARRAKLAREIVSHRLHAEIYESVEELRGSTGRACFPRHGAILISDDEQIDLDALIRAMRESECFLPLVAFSVEAPNSRRIVGALRAGAVDYLCFPQDLGNLGEIVGELIEHAASLANLYEATSLARTRVARLTKQERRVLESVIGGATSKEAARLMGLSNRTVEVHRAAVLQKLEVATSAGAIAMGIAAGIMAFPGGRAPSAAINAPDRQRSQRQMGFDQAHANVITLGQSRRLDANGYRKAS